jgi:hypothetical protein
MSDDLAIRAEEGVLDAYSRAATGAAELPIASVESAYP